MFAHGATRPDALAKTVTQSGAAAASQRFPAGAHIGDRRGCIRP